MRNVLFLAALLLAAAPAAAESVWVEGESCRDHNFVHHNWYDAVRKEAFSGRDWLSHYSEQRPGVATFTLDAADGGQYVLWLRANPLLSAMDYRLGGGKWQAIDLRDDLRGEAMVSQRPDHRSIGWVKVGDVTLPKGRSQISFRCRSKLANHGGIDCFVLTNDGFVPSGVRKPGRETPAGPGDWFEVVFTDDAFSDKSVTDVSRLVPAPAGRFGFLQRDGADLRFAESERPIKFWGCGANVTPGQTPEAMTQRARYLRKHGVNMVRQHSVFGFLGPLRDGQFDARKLDQLDRWFATLKKNGIYSTWSVFYPLRIGPGDGYPPALLAELDKGSTSGVVNFMPKLQDLQWAYVKALLERRNPHTGMRYVDDPALAVVEVHNEDCLFWHWPLNDLVSPKSKMPRHAAELRRQYVAWLRGNNLPADNPRMFGAWQFKGDKPDPAMGRWIKFLAETQRGFYQRRMERLRDLGFRGVTVTTAWRAGGPAADPANLWADTAGDMIDRHNYFGGGAGRHNIVTGKVNNATHLDRPGGGLLSIGLYQVADRPFAVTEWTQCPPNQWKAEAAPLVAFYGMGLGGWDASYHFLNSRTRPGEGWPNLNYYVTDTPHYVGQFPALATSVHLGHVKEGPIVSARRLAVGDLFTGADPLRQDLIGQSHDRKDAAGATPTELLAVGRVTTSFAGGKSEQMSTRGLIESKPARITSATDELLWRYGDRIVEVRTSKTQAVIGFAKDHVIELPAVTVRNIKTPFVSLIFTPLDDKPLAESAHILITALARDRQTGAEYAANGEQLTRLGSSPLLLEPVQAMIELNPRRPGGPDPRAVKSVNVLDVYGVPTGKQVPVNADRFTIDGTYKTYYYEVRR